jgi:hypothetical protein
MHNAFIFLVKKIKIYTNLIKLFHFEIHIILILLKSSILDMW